MSDVLNWRKNNPSFGPVINQLCEFEESLDLSVHVLLVAKWKPGTKFFVSDKIVIK